MRLNSQYICIGLLVFAALVTLTELRISLHDRGGTKGQTSKSPHQVVPDSYASDRKPSPGPISSQTPWPQSSISRPLTPTKECPSPPVQSPCPSTPIFSPADKETSSSPKSPIIDGCQDLPNNDDVLVVMKTGATEAAAKVPTHLLTTLRCTRNYLLFSDLDQDIGPYHLHDVLANVKQEMISGHKDFDLYRKLQDFQKKGDDVGPLNGQAAWDLDKYKFLHMLQETYRMRPAAQWYVFIEADTYLSWHGLLEWVAKLDPSKPYYLGAPVSIGGQSFAHGGSGFILSQGAMNKTVGQDEGLAARYDEAIAHECCGDLVLAKALQETSDIQVMRSWPMINGETPFTQPFDHLQWCHPVVTFHHMSSEEIHRVWKFEAQRNQSAGPLLLSEIFDHFVQPIIAPTREDWDNLSHDLIYRSASAIAGEEATYAGKSYDTLTPPEREASFSFEHCRAACIDNPECKQFKFQNQTCSLARAISRGTASAPKPADQGGRVMSGWMVERVEAFKQRMGPCEPAWIL
ncbi:MAG: hypothetical protein M1819_000508 [Sarea resinae]|nr:MAG: hypothetical protein M1819_000508 [Sarea resinae]